MRCAHLMDMTQQCMVQYGNESSLHIIGSGCSSRRKLWQDCNDRSDCAAECHLPRMILAI